MYDSELTMYEHALDLSARGRLLTGTSARKQSDWIYLSGTP